MTTDPTPPAGEDVYRAAAQAWLTVDPDGPTAKVLAGHRPLVAAIDLAVQLTEQRVRAEIDALAEQPRYIPLRDPLPDVVERRVHVTPELFWDFDANDQAVGMGTTCGASELLRALVAMLPELISAEAADARITELTDELREAREVIATLCETDSAATLAWLVQQRDRHMVGSLAWGPLDDLIRAWRAAHPEDETVSETAAIRPRGDVQASVVGTEPDEAQGHVQTGTTNEPNGAS